MGYIWKALEKGFSEMYWLGGFRTIFFRKLAVTVDRLGFFSVLVRFQTDCTAPLPPLLQHMGI